MLTPSECFSRFVRHDIPLGNACWLFRSLLCLSSSWTVFFILASTALVQKSLLGVSHKLFSLGSMLHLPSAMPLAPGGRFAVPVRGGFIAWCLSSFGALWGGRNEAWCGHLATVPLRVKESGENRWLLCRWESAGLGLSHNLTLQWPEGLLKQDEFLLNMLVYCKNLCNVDLKQLSVFTYAK